MSKFGNSGHETQLLEARSLRGLLPGLAHGFSTGIDFALDPSLSDSLLTLLLREARWRAPEPLMLAQPHSANILFLPKGGVPKAKGGGDQSPLRETHQANGRDVGFLAGYDGAAADMRGSGAQSLLLAVRAADCVPVLAVDPERESYSALHAGWRGIAAGILPNLLRKWREAGSSLKAVRLAFGPSIRSCCFAVRADCISRFDPTHLSRAVLKESRSENGGTVLDLVRVLKNQAREWEVLEEQIEVLPYCTFCHVDEDGQHPFASYRRSNKLGEPTDSRNVGTIGIVDGPCSPER